MKTSPNILFLLSFLSFSSQAQNWELVWQDEFAGSSLNEQKWVHEIGTGSQNGLWGWGNGELQYYKPENTTVSNGTLKITAQEEPNGIVDPFQTWNILNYSSSRIKTDGLFSFKYGKVQARMKTVDGQGFWPAFWMLPSEVHGHVMAKSILWNNGEMMIIPISVLVLHMLAFALTNREDMFTVVFSSQLTKDRMQINFIFMKLDGMKILFTGI